MAYANNWAYAELLTINNRKLLCYTQYLVATFMSATTLLVPHRSRLSMNNDR
ncbi:hypothetical protein VCR14J2_610440 [Vibrio coralliirubri]|nr:hypothetical protein VCR14J2_610440 [Vibrio coralliirubri]